MPRKKTLSDHSNIPERPKSSFIKRSDTYSKESGFKRHYTSETEAEQLIIQFGFKKDFPMVDRLDAAYAEEDLAWRRPTEPMKSHRKNLKALRDVCDLCGPEEKGALLESIREVIHKFGPGEMDLLCGVSKVLEESGKQELVQGRQHKMLEDLALHGNGAASVSLLVSAALSHQGHTGRRDNPAVWAFIEELVSIWKEGTGQDLKCYYQDKSGAYAGEFYLFSLECAKLGGIKLSAGDPGGTIQAIVNNEKELRKTLLSN